MKDTKQGLTKIVCHVTLAFCLGQPSKDLLFRIIQKENT